MDEQLSVVIERVDDIPVLIASIERMGVAELVDEHFRLHGNWQLLVRSFLGRVGRMSCESGVNICREV